MGPIVVGVDGSPGSARALSWAVTQARRLATPLRVVHAWWLAPEYAAYPAVSARDDVARAEELRQGGLEIVERMLAEVADDVHGVDLEREVVNEHPVQALVDRSKDAELVVVGTRGFGGFRTMLLGSVSNQLVQHAHCPVVVIPPRE
jgi:nucleotide-binding universal stress UspA family protein